MCCSVKIVENTAPEYAVTKCDDFEDSRIRTEHAEGDGGSITIAFLAATSGLAT